MRRPPRWLFMLAFIGLVLLGGLLVPVSAATIDPSAYTTSISTISRDSFGNPATTVFTISGQPTSYAVCLKIFGTSGTDYPSYNGKVAAFNAYLTGGSVFAYTASGTTYSACVKFAWSSGTSSAHHVGTHFTFGGPATYEVDWYAPDIPTFDGSGTITNGVVQVGQGGSGGAPQTFKWANSSGVFSPCPWDPQLQIGVWRTSRFLILNRCKKLSGTVTSGVSGPNSLDKDRSWGLASNHVEYVMRDLSYLSVNPAKGSTWTIWGVSVCDRYHGWKEYHPVFQATGPGSGGTTYLSGPQYSTATPSVSGTWSLHSCA